MFFERTSCATPTIHPDTLAGSTSKCLRSIPYPALGRHGSVKTGESCMSGPLNIQLATSLSTLMIQISLSKTAINFVRMARNCGLETRDLLMVVSYGTLTISYSYPISIRPGRCSKTNLLHQSVPVFLLLVWTVAALYEIWQLSSSLPSCFINTCWGNLGKDAQIFSALVRTERSVQGNNLQD